MDIESSQVGKHIKFERNRDCINATKLHSSSCFPSDSFSFYSTAKESDAEDRKVWCSTHYNRASRSKSLINLTSVKVSEENFNCSSDAIKEKFERELEALARKLKKLEEKHSLKNQSTQACLIKSSFNSDIKTASRYSHSSSKSSRTSKVHATSCRSRYLSEQQPGKYTSRRVSSRNTAATSSSSETIISKAEIKRKEKVQKEDHMSDFLMSPHYKELPWSLNRNEKSSHVKNIEELNWGMNYLKNKIYSNVKKPKQKPHLPNRLSECTNEKNIARTSKFVHYDARNNCMPADFAMNSNNKEEFGVKRFSYPMPSSRPVNTGENSSFVMYTSKKNWVFAKTLESQSSTSFEVECAFRSNPILKTLYTDFPERKVGIDANVPSIDEMDSTACNANESVDNLPVVSITPVTPATSTSSKITRFRF